MIGKQARFFDGCSVKLPAKGQFMHYRRLPAIWTVAYLIFLALGVQAQTKPAIKSITVYQDPG
jgi:hypothetical protein